MGQPDALPRDETIAFVLGCQNSDGGFGAAAGHDSHMLYTLSAVQILATIDALGELENSRYGGSEKVATCTSSCPLLKSRVLTFCSCSQSTG